MFSYAPWSLFTRSIFWSTPFLQLWCGLSGILFEVFIVPKGCLVPGCDPGEGTVEFLCGWTRARSEHPAQRTYWDCEGFLRTSSGGQGRQFKNSMES